MVVPDLFLFPPLLFLARFLIGSSSSEEDEEGEEESTFSFVESSFEALSMCFAGFLDSVSIGSPFGLLSFLKTMSLCTLLLLFFTH